MDEQRISNPSGYSNFFKIYREVWVRRVLFAGNDAIENHISYDHNIGMVVVFSWQKWLASRFLLIHFL
mgnify:CR=1 FL=1